MTIFWLNKKHSFLLFRCPSYKFFNSLQQKRTVWTTAHNKPWWVSGNLLTKKAISHTVCRHSQRLFKSETGCEEILQPVREGGGKWRVEFHAQFPLSLFGLNKKKQLGDFAQWWLTEVSLVQNQTENAKYPDFPHTLLLSHPMMRNSKNVSP